MSIPDNLLAPAFETLREVHKYMSCCSPFMNYRNPGTAAIYEYASYPRDWLDIMATLGKWEMPDGLHLITEVFIDWERQRFSLRIMCTDLPF